MQHTQFNFVVAGLLLAANPALGGTIAKPHKPDPLLDGGPVSACAAGADYAAGTDVNGQRVAPADIGTPRVPVPEGISVPLRRDQGQTPGGRGLRAQTGGMAGEGPYVMLDGRRLEPLVNPAPCR